MKHTTTLAFAIMMLVVSVASASTTTVYEKEQGTGKEADIVVKDSLDEWLDELETYECDGCGPAYKRLDSNGRYSYGCLQFQQATFAEKASLYNILWEEEDIFRCDLQKMVAREMFLGEGAAAGNHWSTSIFVRGLGLPPGF